MPMPESERVIVALDVESAEQARQLVAQLAAQARCHGVIASAQAAALLRTHLPSGMLIVTPGTQMPGDAKTDQARTATPANAIRSGSTHVVMGRSITQAADPAAAFAAACTQVAAALAGTGASAGAPAARGKRP